MARSLRIEYPGAWYHVMNRGLCRREIFNAEEHAQLFYDLLDEIHIRYQVEVHAYCLMGNHYHLCLRTPHPNLGRAMRHLNGVFTQRYNNLMKLDGPLFRGRYKAILVEAQSYFLQLTRYIHLNPVSAGIVQHPKDYLWSSYRYLLNEKEKPNWLYFLEILKNFDSKDPIQDYRQFVFEGIDEKLKTFFDPRKSLPILGSHHFIEEIKTKISASRHAEIPDSFQLIKNKTIKIEDIVRHVAKYYKLTPAVVLASSKLTDLPHKVAIYLAVQMLDENQITIAKFFNNISYWRVSRIYRQVLLKIKKNVSLLEDINNIKNQLVKGQI